MSNVEELLVKPNQFFGNLSEGMFFFLASTALNASDVREGVPNESEKSAIVVSRGSLDLYHEVRYGWEIPKESYQGTALYEEAVILTSEIMEIEGMLAIIDASQIPEGMYFTSITGAVYKKEGESIVWQKVSKNR